MAIEIYVFLETHRLPSFQQWVEAIGAVGFPLNLPDPVDLRCHRGFLPAILGQEESGFEFYFAKLGDPGTPPRAAGATPASDAVAMFRFTQPDESLAAVLAAGVLTSITGGTLFDPASGDIVTSAASIQFAQEELRAVGPKVLGPSAEPGAVTPAQWAKLFEQTMRRIHPDYKLNRAVRGREVECRREDATGLFLSHNCIRIRETYYQCFAVLLTPARLGPFLNSPFILGTRFDHNCSVGQLYYRDYKEQPQRGPWPHEWDSWHPVTAKGAKTGAGTCARTAEGNLWPVYRSWLSQSRNLISLFGDVTALLDAWGVTPERLQETPQPGPLVRAFAEKCRTSDPPDQWTVHRLLCFNALRLADAHGLPAQDLLRYWTPSLDVKAKDIVKGTGPLMQVPCELRSAVLFMSSVEDFMAARSDLPRIVENLTRLRNTDR